MYFEFACASCQKKLKVREDHVGQKVRCPYCHHTQLVQAPESPAETEENPFSFLNEPSESSASSTSSSPTGAAAGTSPAGSTKTPAGAVAAKQKPKAVARTKQAASARKQDEVTSGTDVSATTTGIIGFAAFVVIYAALYPFRGSFLGALLWERGWVQFAETFLAAWAVAILVFKFRKLSAQKDSMLFDLLPTSISRDITPDSADKFVQNIRELPVRPSESFLVNRVLRGLEHFRILRDSSEVVGRVGSQSDIDANEVDSSYTLLKVLVWAIPILGFIGTVQGIGMAVGSFAATMQAANDMSALKESFNEVTGGLATAFDTTLLALLLSMLIMFPMSSLQKAEQDLLNWVDEYCNENLFKRLKGESSGAAESGVDSKALQTAIDAAMANHHAELRTWTKKLETIGETLTQHVAKGWAKLEEQSHSRQSQTMKQLQQSADAINEVAARLKVVADKQSESLGQFGDRAAKAQDDLADALKQNAAALRQSTDSAQQHLGTVEQGIASLNQVLTDLGGKQIVIEQSPSKDPPRRRWFFGK